MAKKKVPVTYWTEALTLEEGQYTRRTKVRNPTDATLSTERRPFLGDGGWSSLLNHSRKTSPNWWLVEADYAGLVPVDPLHLQLRPALLAEASSSWFPVPLPAGSKLFEFSFEGLRYVVDSVTLIQRLVALEAGLFSALMSPFRGCFFSTRQFDSVVYTALDLRALRDEGYQPANLLRHDAMCMSYWMSSEERLAQLDLCSLSILNNEPLHIPSVGCSLFCEVRGMTDGETVYVQSLNPNVDVARSYDLSWRADFTAAHIWNQRGKVAKSYTLCSEGCYPNVASHPELRPGAMTAARLSPEDAQRIPELVGWGW